MFHNTPISLTSWFNHMLAYSCLQIHQPPVYGQLDLSFTDYMGPGIISRLVVTLFVHLSFEI